MQSRKNSENLKKLFEGNVGAKMSVVLHHWNMQLSLQPDNAFQAEAVPDFFLYNLFALV